MSAYPLTDSLRALVALLAIVNPIGAVPIFVAVTSDQTASDRVRTSRTTAIAVGITLLAAALAGQAILRFFGIDLDAFRVGGGLLILLMAIHMLQGSPNRARNTPEETQEGVAKDEVAVVPLAIPLLAGPGSISTVIITAQNAVGWFGYVALLLSIVNMSSAVNATMHKLPLSTIRSSR